MAHESSFDIKTAQDFLHKMILPQYEEFKTNNASSRHALLTIILVSHMHEWVRPNKPSYPKDIEEMPGLAKKIADGTKHFVPKAKTRTRRGFSSAFSNGFARPLIIKLPGGGELSVDQLLRKLVEFWKEQDRLGNLKSGSPPQG